MSISMKRYNDTIITPKDDRILFDQIFDDYGLIYGGSATMAASNKIHVGAARGFVKGTEVIIEAEDIAVNLSDSGTKNGRLKIVMDLADTETPIKFESEVAASFPALEQDANINYDNGRYEVVFATYKATETTISSVALVMPTMQSVKAKIQGINQSLTNKANALVQKLHPVGSWYFSTVATNPVNIFGFGTWQLVTDRFLVGAGASYFPGAMGGEAVHTLTAAELPTHQHNVLSGTLGGNNGNYKFMLSSQSMYGTYDGQYGVITDDRFIAAASSAYCGNQPHNNMPPYYAIYMWVRTA